MPTEPDELATRAANDRFFQNFGLEDAIKSVIEKTRRHWDVVPESFADADAVDDDCAGPRRSDEIEFSY